jgi:hypothetical protein
MEFNEEEDEEENHDGGGDVALMGWQKVLSATAVKSPWVVRNAIEELTTKKYT